MFWKSKALKPIANRLPDMSVEDPEDMLYQFDVAEIKILRSGPSIFFAYVCDSDDTSSRNRTLYTYTTTNRIRKYKQGLLSTYEMLDGSMLFAADTDAEGNVVATYLIEGGLDSVPDYHKPREGALLSHLLEQKRA